MQIQKKRSKDASKQVDLTATDALREQLRQIKATQFKGYEDVAGAGLVVAILQNGEMVSTAHKGVTLHLQLPCGLRHSCNLYCSPSIWSLHSFLFTTRFLTASLAYLKGHAKQGLCALTKPRPVLTHHVRAY